MKAKYFDRYGNEVDQRHACDDHGALRNGCTMRVPFQARDGLSTTQLAVRDAAARDARARAYELYDQEIQQARRNTDPRGRSFESTGFGSSGPRGQSEGDACTIDGRSGHLKMVGGQLQCVPDKTDAVPLIGSSGHRPGFAFVDAATREARARMYALKDVEYENAWRGYDDHPSSETDKQSDKAANHAEIFLMRQQTRTKQMTRHYEDFREDNPFDENGLLREGHKTRVSLAMRDALTPLQREIATKRARLTDGNGNCDEFAFSRPGYRILVGASVNDARDARDTAYAEYLDYITNAWRTKPPRM